MRSLLALLLLILVLVGCGGGAKKSEEPAVNQPEAAGEEQVSVDKDETDEDCHLPEWFTWQYKYRPYRQRHVGTRLMFPECF